VLGWYLRQLGTNEWMRSLRLCLETSDARGVVIET
jgi:hypothetical protein